MTTHKNIENSVGELPGQFADRLGSAYASAMGKEHKKTNGQYFTPLEIASHMGSFVDSKHEKLRILDPGCGTAVLACSLIESLVIRNKNLKDIELSLYEIDQDLIPYTRESAEYLQSWLLAKGVNLTYDIRSVDFILENAVHFDEGENLFPTEINALDIIISNPPYFKLAIDDKRAVVSKAVVNGHPNIYALFMALSARMLKKDGQLVFITPRSYASGGYFKQFREYFFKIIELDKVHLFDSRKDTFGRDKVLQETVIIKGTRKDVQDPKHEVLVYSSRGLKDIKDNVFMSFPQKELIDLSSTAKILYLPTCEADEAVLDVFKKWNGSLHKYNIQISTGPVVAFRARQFIHETYQNGSVFLAPLLWLHNIKQMELVWPIVKPEKGQYIRIEDASRSVLIPNKNYVLLRRFSSKDDKSRLIAAPYFSNFIEAECIGVENKVNYIYRPKGHLERNEVVGICALLNSVLFDAYFRIFNGNVNVSATELREISLPPLEQINEIGNAIILSNDFSVENANKIVMEQFEFSPLVQ